MLELNVKNYLFIFIFFGLPAVQNIIYIIEYNCNIFGPTTKKERKKNKYIFIHSIKPVLID